MKKLFCGINVFGINLPSIGCALIKKSGHASQGVPRGEFWGQLPPNAGKNFGGGPLDSISKDAARTNHNFTPSTPIHRAAVFLYTQSLGREVEYTGRPTSIST